MSVEQAFVSVGVAVGLACVSSLGVIVIARIRRGLVQTRSRALLAPYRGALITIASGEDDDGQATVALEAVPPRIWSRLRSSVVAFLPKVRGVPAEELSALMCSHGEIDEARRMLTSRSAVGRARAAYLLGLVRDSDSVALLRPLLSDPVADVRMVAARALGTIGDPSAAGDILLGLRTRRGEIGLPAWVAAEALLSMGVKIAPALQIGLESEDPAARSVSALVAGHGAHLSAVPQLRTLLATDSDGEVRATAAAALGRVGRRVEDAATLARYVDSREKAALRRTCTTALGELGTGESVEPLTRLLGDPDRRLAELAGDSLVRIGSEGIARLEEATTTGQGARARAARGALGVAALRGQLVAGSTGS